MPENMEGNKPPTKAETKCNMDLEREKNLAQEREDAAKQRLAARRQIQADFAGFRKNPGGVSKEHLAALEEVGLSDRAAQEKEQRGTK